MQNLIPLIFIIENSSGFIFCLLLINETFISAETSTIWFWNIVFLSVFCGGAIGCVAMILPKYGFIIIRALLGVLISLVLVELLFYKIP